MSRRARIVEKIYGKEVQIWDRLVAACNLEKQWMHERIGRFYTTQGFLLAAVGLAVTSRQMSGQILLKYIVASICFVGMTTSLTAFVAIGSASWMHQVWSSRLFRFAKDSRYINKSNWFTFGCCSQIPGYLARYVPLLTPMVLFAVWISLFFVLSDTCFVGDVWNVVIIKMKLLVSNYKDFSKLH